MFTKNYTMRLRLRRDLNADMPRDGHEYGDYEKYDKNTVNILNDKGQDDRGHDNFLKNYNNMLRQMKTEDGEELRKDEADNFAEAVGDYETHMDDMLSKFNRARFAVDYDQVEKEYEREKQMVRDWEDEEI